MNKKLLIKRFFIISVFAFMLSSCVDSTYDLDKELDDEMNFGGSLAIPVGSTQKNTLKKIIETEVGSDVIKLQADGTYALVFNDKLEFDMPQIPSVSIDLPRLDIAPVSLAFSMPSPIVFTGGALKKSFMDLPTAEFISSVPFVINENLPEEISSISSVTFGNNSNITIAIDIVGNKGGVERMKFNNLKIVFPDFFEFADASSVKNEIVLNDEFNVNNLFEKQIIIDRFKFASNPVSSNKLDIDGVIKFEGAVAISQLSGSVIPSDLKIRATVSMGKKTVKLLEGKVTIDPVTVNENWVLDDIPNFLQGNDVTLDVRPIIMLDASNSIGIPINVDLEMAAVIKGNDVEGSINSIELPVKPSDILGELTTTKFWIAGNIEGMPSGYSFVESANLGSMFIKVPDAIRIDVNADFDQSKTHVVDLGVLAYPVKMKYDVKVPLSFGDKLSIVYRDTMDLNLGSDNISDYISTAQLRAKVTNTIPLNLKLKVIPADYMWHTVEGISFDVLDEILPGNGSEVPTISDVNIDINETRKGAFNRVSYLILEVEATNNSAVQNIPLAEDQYFQMDMTLRLPEGVNLNK